MSTITPLYLDNDSVLEVDRLKNELTGAFLSDATVTVTLVEKSSGEPVAGETWPKPMDYVADSSGLYRATLPYTLALAAGARYDAVITADGGDGLRARWSVECVGRRRE